jgi:hypothetical protein
MRAKGFFAGGLLYLLLSAGGAGAQTSPIVGMWATTLNPGKPSVIYVTMTLAPNQQLTEHWMDRLGIAFNLVGNYQFDPTKGALTVVITDYSPKADCTPGSGTGCTSVIAPEVQTLVGKQIVDQIQFQAPNFMRATGPDGAVTTWVRMN